MADDDRHKPQFSAMAFYAANSGGMLLSQAEACVSAETVAPQVRAQVRTIKAD